MLAGKYRVERLLGTGAMGFVVAAHHILLDEKFAIKLLHDDALGDGERVARFAREARAAAKIKSEHVARVVDVGALPSGAPYMVMEYLDGGDLDAWIKQRGPLPIAQAVEFMLQSCVAVADAHALGIVHRDLKPSNLYCVRRSDGQLCIKLLDFGISKFDQPIVRTELVTDGSPEDTGAMGSPAYMSPEQILSPAEVDSRSDIWSLGVILYELLAACAPFESKTVTELVGLITTGLTPSIRALRPDVPVELEAVIGKCLEKKPSERYQDVAELAAALASFAPPRAKGLAARTASIVAASKGAASRLPLPPFSLNFASFQGLPEAKQRTQRVSLVIPRWSQIALALAFASALTAFVAALWQREPEVTTAHQAKGRAALEASPSAAPASDEEPNAGAAQGHSPLARPPADPAPPAAPSSVPSAAGGSRKSAPPKLRARSSVPLVKPPPAQSHAHCNPPYYFDGNGNRMFKKECV